MRSRTFAVAALVVAMGWAQDPGMKAWATEAQSEAPPDADSEAVIGYCLNIADKAADARIARQTATLKQLEARIQAKVTELQQHQKELEVWVEEQSQIRDAAETSLVEIYATMDPDSAAGQMNRLDPQLASSVLHKLKPRQASAILNVMKPDLAARLVKIIAAATRKEAPKP